MLLHFLKNHYGTVLSTYILFQENITYLWNSKLSSSSVLLIYISSMLISPVWHPTDSNIRVLKLRLLCTSHGEGDICQFY